MQLLLGLFLALTALFFGACALVSFSDDMLFGQSPGMGIFSLIICAAAIFQFVRLVRRGGSDE